MQAAAIAVVFLTIQLWLLPRHELWLDELQVWMLTRDSTSVWYLFQNIRYEGHPALWHLLVMPLTRVSDHPELMQVLHVAIATASIYLMARFSPFDLLTKVLLSLSYFLFYEYAQVARNYAIGVLLAFAFCALFRKRESHSILLAVILFLLAQTSVFGAILSLCLGMTLLSEKLLAVRLLKQPWHISTTGTIASLIVLAGILLAVIQLKPPQDSGFATGWFPYLDVGRLVTTWRALLGGYFPLPVPQINYWNSLALLSLPLAGLKSAAVLAVISLMVMVAVSLRRRPSALLLYLTITLSCLAFYYVKYPGSLRHHGFLFIGLVMSLWISPFCIGRAPRSAPELAAPKTGMRDLASAAFLLVLSVQSVAGVMAASLDYRYDFSQLKEAALFIGPRMGPTDLLIGTAEFPVAGVSAYLKKPIYYLDSERYGTFVRWDDRRKHVEEATLPSSLTDLLNTSNKAFLISNGKADTSKLGLKVRLVLQLEPSVQEYENLMIYEISR